MQIEHAAGRVKWAVLIKLTTLKVIWAERLLKLSKKESKKPMRELPAFSCGSSIQILMEDLL